MSKVLISVTRRHHFQAAHLYHQPQMTPAQNKKIFGDCFSEHGHGHNYTLEVEFSGPIDPLTGMILNLSEIDKGILKLVKTFDFKHINFDVKYFAIKPKGPTVISTTENLALYFFNELTQSFSKYKKVKILRVRLYETPDLYSEVR